MSSTGRQRDAESRDSASRVRADHLSGVRIAGSPVEVGSRQGPSQQNQFKVCLCPGKHNCVFRTSKESVADGVLRSSDGAQRLFNAVKELLQIPSDEQEQQAADADGYCLGFST